MNNEFPSLREKNHIALVSQEYSSVNIILHDGAVSIEQILWTKMK